MSTQASYLERIHELYPNQTFTRVELNHDGMVNDIVVLDGKLVCRFPKDDWAKALLAKEAALLELVSQHVTVAVPWITRLEKDVAIYPYLPGVPLTRERLYRLPPDKRRNIMLALGEFLSQLHGIPLDKAEAAGAVASVTNRSLSDWQAFYKELEEEVFPLLMRHQQTAIKDHFTPVLTGALELSYTPRFINGDPGVYHILFNQNDQTLAGVIDFGTAGIGDPATDIAVLLGQYGEGLLALMKSYSALEDCLERARFWAGTFELQWALAGIKTNDKELLLAHLGGARDRLPFGFSRHSAF